MWWADQTYVVDGDVHISDNCYVHGDRYDRAVAALKEAALWLSAEPLQTVRAAIDGDRR